MSLDASIALLSVEELKIVLGLELTLTDTEKARLEYLINDASLWFERYCGRKFIAPGAAITEVFDGDGTEEYYVKNIPITGTITSANIQYRNNTGDNWASITATFSYDTATGRVYTTDGYVFDRGKDNWRITYSYGYAQASVPSDLKIACATLVALRKKAFDDKAIGVSAVTFPDNTISYNFEIPKAVKDVADRYRRVF